MCTHFSLHWDSMFKDPRWLKPTDTLLQCQALVHLLLTQLGCRTRCTSCTFILKKVASYRKGRSHLFLFWGKIGSAILHRLVQTGVNLSLCGLCGSLFQSRFLSSGQGLEVRAVATSLALSHNVALEEIIRTVGLHLVGTFARFYLKDLARHSGHSWHCVCCAAYCSGIASPPALPLFLGNSVWWGFTLCQPAGIEELKFSSCCSHMPHLFIIFHVVMSSGTI